MYFPMYGFPRPPLPAGDECQNAISADREILAEFVSLMVFEYRGNLLARDWDKSPENHPLAWFFNKTGLDHVHVYSHEIRGWYGDSPYYHPIYELSPLARFYDLIIAYPGPHPTAAAVIAAAAEAAGLPMDVLAGAIANQAIAQELRSFARAAGRPDPDAEGEKEGA